MDTDGIDTQPEAKPMIGNRPPAGNRLHSFLRFLCNPAAGTVMGRTAGSWGRIGLFYIAFYTFLTCFFAGLLAVFMATVDNKVPSYEAEDSLLKGNPGLPASLPWFGRVGR